MADSNDIKLVLDASQVEHAITSLQKVSDQYAKAANEADQVTAASKKQSAALKDVADSADRAAKGHAGVSREVVVLAHELSQGNVNRFGGSLMVLAEQLDLVKFAMSGAGLAILAVVGVIGAFGFAAVQNAVEANKFAKALQLTGNYAAVSAGQIEQLAKAQSALTGQSTGNASKDLQAVAGSGLFNADQLVAASRALGDYRRLTGQTAEEAIKNFQGMENGVAKWAAKQNESLHFLTLSEFDHIKSLEETGHAEEAATETLNALAQAIESRGTPVLEAHTTVWEKFKNVVHETTDALHGMFNPNENIESKIKAINLEIQQVRNANTGNPAAAADTIQALQGMLQQLEQEQFRAQEHAKDQAIADQYTKAGIAAKNYTDEVLKAAKAGSVLNLELQKFKDAAKAQAQAGAPMSEADFAAGIAEIKKRYTPTPVKGTDTVGASFQSQAADLAKLVDEYDQLNGATAKTHVAMMQAEIDSGKYKNALTDQVKAELLWRAAAQDSQEALNKKTKAENAEYDAAVKQHLAQAQQITAYRESIVEQQISREAMLKYGATTDDATVSVDKHKVAQAELALQIAKTAGASDAEIQKLQDNLAAQKELLQLDQDKKDDNDKWAADQKTFTAGWKRALNQYKADVADASKLSESLMSTAADGMGTALANFAKTGKLSFSGLVDGIIDDLAKWAAKELVVISLEEIASSMGYANGGAFQGGTQVFADGGVVASPTYFGMSGGRTGLMGEAGPEAIMPLTRGRDGKLGVAASGSAASNSYSMNAPITINVQGDASNPATHQQLARTVVNMIDARWATLTQNAMRSGGVMNPTR